MKILGVVCFSLIVAGALAQEKPTASVGSAVLFVEQAQSLAPIAGRGVVLRDFNGDGNLDAFVVADNTADSQGLRVYFGDEHGHFADSGQVLPYASLLTQRPAVADVDGNGTLDVVVGSTLWLNDGKGRFVQRDILIDDKQLELTSVALADVDGDGIPDLVAIEQWKMLRVFLNDGKGRFRDSGQRLDLGANAGSAVMANLALADVDGNGSVDVVTTGWRNNPADVCPNRIWLNDGKGNFTDSGLRLGNAFSWDGAVGDIDGDGDADVFVVNLRLVDDSKMPPTFGCAPVEVWLTPSGCAHAE